MTKRKIRVHFILEGNEEDTLFKIIEELLVMENIEMTYKNAMGGGNVPIYYQYAYASANYDIIYCVYDVDYSPKKEKDMYQKIRKGLFDILGDEQEINKISLCTNPNTLLIILLGYDKLDALKEIKAKKSENTELIKKYCPKIGNKKDYDASAWQLELLKNDYIYDGVASIDKILENIGLINEKYEGKEIASNLLPVIKALKDDDGNYFEKKMEENS